MAKKQIHWGHYSGAGIQMALTVLICLWIGQKVGEYFDIEPWGSLVGVLFGVFAGMANLLKILK